MQASFSVREEAGHTLKSAITHTAELDLMNGAKTRGADLSLTTELAGLGGNVHHVRAQASASYARPLPFSTALHFSLRGGRLLPLPSDTLARVAWPAAAHGDAVRVRPGIADRFFLGGAGDVRGFAQHGIGPRVADDALGGDAFWASAVRFTLPFPYRPVRALVGDALRVHVFANAGSLTGVVPGEATSAWTARLRTDVAAAWGVGLTARLAFAVLELNYCVPLLVPARSCPAPGVQFGIGVNYL